jgi:hypothetical protein
LVICLLNASAGFLIISTKLLQNCENDSLFRLNLGNINSNLASHSKPHICWSKWRICLSWLQDNLQTFWKCWPWEKLRCAFSTYFFIKLYNLQTKPSFFFCIYFSWMYMLDLVLSMNQPIFGLPYSDFSYIPKALP